MLVPVIISIVGAASAADSASIAALAALQESSAASDRVASASFSPADWDASAANPPIRLGEQSGVLQGRDGLDEQDAGLNESTAWQYISTTGVARLAEWAAASPVVRGKRICLTCPAALDAEAHRVLDWVAYHSLLGVDCFVIFLDAVLQHFDNPTVRYAWRMLARAPNVQLFEQPHGTLGGETYAANLTEVLARMPADTPRPEFIVNIDVDEFLVVDDQEAEAGAGEDTGEKGEDGEHPHSKGQDKTGRDTRPKHTKGHRPRVIWNATRRGDTRMLVRNAPAHARTLPPQRTPPPPGVLLRRLRAAAGDGPGVVLFVFHYGTSFVVSPPPMKERPEFAYLTRRHGDPDRHRVLAPPKNESWNVFYGKVAVRVASGGFLVNPHNWVYNDTRTSENRTQGTASPSMRLPNGTELPCVPGPPKRLPVFSCPLLSITTRQPISINHYAYGSVDRCIAKAERARYFSGRKKNSSDCKDDVHMHFHVERNWYYFNYVYDPVLAQFAAATRAPGHWSRVFACRDDAAADRDRIDRIREILKESGGYGSEGDVSTAIPACVPPEAALLPPA